MTSIALVTTTINVPHLLSDYAADAKAFGRNVKFIVSGDRKTPVAAAEFCATVERDHGIGCEYLSPSAQKEYLRAWPALARHLPWDCVQRRDVALLKAAADGADVIITIDDDNFLAQEDYFGAHASVGQSLALDTFGADGQWFNVCQFLAEENGRPFFHRGYGITARQLPNQGEEGVGKSEKIVAVNAGLWLGDPDIDAVTRIATPVNATAYRRGENFFLAPGARSPFNSQNTALSRAAMAAYFLSPFVGRHDDIYASFIVKHIADHLGHGVSYGFPLVKQERNAHDLLNDLALENLGMKITDDLTSAIFSSPLQATDYAGCLTEVCDFVEGAMHEVEGLTPGERAQLSAFFAGCRVWAGLPLW